MAWTGNGKVKRVDVSTDGGANWQSARLHEPVLSKALTKFTLPWRWDGAPALLESRVIDETGYVQPTIAQLRKQRGTNSVYHNNSIQTWQVKPRRERVRCPARVSASCCSAPAWSPPPAASRLPPSPAITAMASGRRLSRSPAGISMRAARMAWACPPGRGGVHRGTEVYAEQCAACHGTFGEGEGRFPKLVGGAGTLRDDRPELTVGSYWPFAPTLWDYINRAMPMPAPHTLSADDVYALTAYILNLNDIVPSEFVADRESLPKVKMPNRDNFLWTDPRPDTMAKPCMNACVDPADVKIASTAEGKNLTPRTTGPLDTMQAK